MAAGPDDAPHVLVAQLHHLASLSTLPNVRIGVIPWRTPMRSCPDHAFIIYGEPGTDPDVGVHTGAKTAATEHRDPAEIAVYERLWELLVADPLFDDAGRAELARIAAEVGRGTPSASPRRSGSHPAEVAAPAE